MLHGGASIAGLLAASGAAAQGPATLDARPYLEGLDARAGGIELTTANTLNVAGTLTAWAGGQERAGSVILSAARTATIGRSLEELAASDYFAQAQAQAATAIDVTGRIVAGDVTIGAAVTASSDVPFDPAFIGVSNLSGIVTSGCCRRHWAAVRPISPTCGSRPVRDEYGCPEEPPYCLR